MKSAIKNIVMPIFILIILCSIIIRPNISFALTDDEMLELALDWQEWAIENVSNDIFTGNPSQENIIKAATELRKRCDEKNISVEDLRVCLVRNGSSGANSMGTPIYKIFQEAKNSNSDTSIDERVAKEKKLREKIATLMNGYKNKTTEELLEIDKLIKQYKNENPGEWGNGKSNEVYVYAIDLNDELIQRKDLQDGYTTSLGESQKNREEENNNVSSKPPTAVLGQYNPNASHTPDEVVKEGGNFIDIGKNEGNKIDANNLKTASDTLYNILLTIGIIIAVGVGIYLGIKFMLSSAEDKAKVKESLIPYIAGCVVVFGAFIIWKLAITLLGQIS